MRMSFDRILIIGDDSRSAIETFFAKAFRKIGVRATQFNPKDAIRHVLANGGMTRLLRRWLPGFTDRFVQQFFESNRDWDAVLVIKGAYLSYRGLVTAQSLAPSAKWLCFNPDSPFERSYCSEHVRRAVPLYDAYFIWSRSLVDPIRDAGSPLVKYLPFAHDRDEHRIAASFDQSLGGTITFVGTHDRRREAILESVADLPLRIFGNGWDGLRRGSRLRTKVQPGALYGEDLRRVVSSSLATINILRPQNTGSHNMRTFEVPAMGGVMVTDRTPEQAHFFPENTASLMYDGSDELRQVLSAIVDRRIHVESIREKAIALAKGHDYEARAKQILASAADISPRRLVSKSWDGLVTRSS